MKGCCPGRDEERFERQLGLFALFCVIALAVFLATSWLLSSRSSRFRINWEKLHNAEEHEAVPMPRSHLDRG
jgi:cytochrome b